MAKRPSSTSSKQATKRGKTSKAATASARSETLDLAIPKGFKPRKGFSASQAHLLVASSAASMGPPPYICVPTGPSSKDPCLRFHLDPNTGQYNIPPFGEVIDCTLCRRG